MTCTRFPGSLASQARAGNSSLVAMTVGVEWEIWGLCAKREVTEECLND